MGVTEYFPEPQAPIDPMVVLQRHEHVLTMVGADLVPNGKWYSRWRCEICTDHFQGDAVGPVPPGLCTWCGWVQREWPREHCEDCHSDLALTVGL